MRLAYTSDLHGNMAHYRDFLQLAREDDAEAAIIGGDLLPHTSSRASAIAQQRRFITEELRPLLEDHRAAGGPPVLAIPGNDDWAAAYAHLEDLAPSGLLTLIHMRPVLIGSWWVAGYGCVPPTPFSIKDWERRESAGAEMLDYGLVSAVDRIVELDLAAFAALPTIADDLAALAALSDPTRTIYVCHTPPAGLGLDVTLRGSAVGSADLRAFLERHRPPLALHGHIHEAPRTGRWAAQLGPTWCVNPGQGARLHAVTLELPDVAGTLRHTLGLAPPPQGWAGD